MNFPATRRNIFFYSKHTHFGFTVATLSMFQTHTNPLASLWCDHEALARTNQWGQGCNCGRQGTNSCKGGKKRRVLTNFRVRFAWRVTHSIMLLTTKFTQGTEHEFVTCFVYSNCQKKSHGYSGKYSQWCATEEVLGIKLLWKWDFWLVLENKTHWHWFWALSMFQLKTWTEVGNWTALSGGNKRAIGNHCDEGPFKSIGSV